MLLSKYCSLNFTPIYPEEYNEEVKIENVNQNEIIKLNHVDWNKLDKLTINIENLEYNNFKHSVQKCDGDKTEEDFFELCKHYCIKYCKASSGNDYFNHFDCEIILDDKLKILIDIKGLKSLRRHGPKQNQYFFVELNLEGWLFGGKANYIAIEFSKKIFLIFDKYKLQDYVLKTVQYNLPVVAWPEQSYNRVYIRKSEKHTSVLSLLSILDAYRSAGVGKFM